MRPLDDDRDLDALVERAGRASYVLLGEASHGTSEYYTWRARLTERLLREKGFSFVAVEGDWPDCRKVDRYVKDAAGGDALSVLRDGFDRWPTWMWANREVATFAERLRDLNASRPRDGRAGFYGLDVYSLWDSLRFALEWLERRDGSAVEAARRAVACFQPYHREADAYASATTWARGCEEEVARLLAATRAARVERDGEGWFDAEQNALVAKNAESYYRAMARGGPESWNVRDRHMVETLERLMAEHGPGARCVVWEHNTHVGDARATDMVEDGMVNVGQLVREAHAPDDVFAVGFGSHEGTVIAADAWEAPMRRKTVPPGRAGSWEDLMHRTGVPAWSLVLDEVADLPGFRVRRGHRAIGVVYRPQHERFGNYVPTVLPDRYDAFVFVDRTTALHPLHLVHEEKPEVPETYPFGE